jgi:hypothetical protein
MEDKGDKMIYDSKEHAEKAVEELLIVIRKISNENYK